MKDGEHFQALQD